MKIKAFRAPKTPELTAAQWAERASSLLQGGINPHQLPTILQIDLRTAGDGAAEWALLSAAWQLAQRTGAPLAASLQRIAQGLRAVERLRNRRAVVLTGPKSTIRLVCALPVLGILLGTLLGFEPVSALCTSWGLLATLLGMLLLAAGIFWATALANQVARRDTVVAMEYELLHIALAGGAAPAAAIRSLIAAVDHAGAGWIRFEMFSDSGSVQRLIRTAESFGTPLRNLLVTEAEACRNQAHAELEAAAERLGVAVLIPLGVCVLPAFVLLGVFPILMGVLRGVL